MIHLTWFPLQGQGQIQGHVRKSNGKMLISQMSFVIIGKFA